MMRLVANAMFLARIKGALAGVRYLLRALALHARWGAL